MRHLQRLGILLALTLGLLSCDRTQPVNETQADAVKAAVVEAQKAAAEAKQAAVDAQQAALQSQHYSEQSQKVAEDARASAETANRAHARGLWK